MRNSNKKIDTVLFDFDGTIMDTNDVILASWQHTFLQVTGEKGDEKKILETFGEPLEKSLKTLLPKFDVEELLSVYREYQYENYESMIELFPGVEELLSTLKQNGYKMGIVTNRFRHTTEIGLNKFGLDRFFTSLVACNEAKKNKPFADPVLLALEQLGSSPESAILVGDSANDILSGKNACIETVRVAWAVATDGGHDVEEVDPDYVIETPNELLKILDLERPKK